MNIEAIDSALDYPTAPLPQDLLARFPQMTRGQIIVTIRKARGMSQQVQLKRQTGIPCGTLCHIEASDSIPRPRYLLSISRVLKMDPIIIACKKPWKEASAGLTDDEKMFFLRIRRGWTQKDLAVELEKAGLVFNTNRLGSKRTTIAQWERGAATPTPEKRSIIRRVLSDETLFQKTAVPVPKTVVLRAAPVAPAEPKPEPKPELKLTTQPIIKPEPARQKQIDARAYEALAILGGLRESPGENASLDSRPSVLRIRTLIRELRQMKAEEEAQVVEIDLEKKLTVLRQKIAETQKPTRPVEEKPKISAEDRKRANRSISSLLQQFPGKSILQILPILVRYQDWVAVRVAVERIEQHQAHKLTPEDRVYLEEVKSQIISVQK